jgi:hypothetical protein
MKRIPIVAKLFCLINIKKIVTPKKIYGAIDLS